MRRVFEVYPYEEVPAAALPGACPHEMKLTRHTASSKCIMLASSDDR
jgi:hypothetical protein